MTQGRLLTSDAEFHRVLSQSRVIAVLGLSPKPERDSHRVARYLVEQGYDIVPVRPGQGEILGLPVVARLEEVQRPVDVVTAFINPARIMDHVPGALALGPRVFWMQLGIENAGAADALTRAGIDVVMNRCIKIDHERLIRKTRIV